MTVLAAGVTLLRAESVTVLAAGVTLLRAVFESPSNLVCHFVEQAVREDAALGQGRGEGGQGFRRG